MAFTDTDGTWSDAVWEEVKQSSGCSKLDDFEVIPVKFEVKGIPLNGDTEVIEAEMTTILDRVFLRLEDMIPGMLVFGIDYQSAYILGDEAIMYFTAKVRKDDYRDFKPIIIQELRDSYLDVLYTIPFSDVVYIKKDLEFDWCAQTDLGGYTLCVQEELQSSIIVPSKPPSSIEMSQPATIQSNNYPAASIQSIQNADDDATLPGWAIFLIVLSILLLLGCIGYLIFDRHIKSKEVLYDDNNSEYTDDSQPWRGQAHTAIADHESWVKSSQSVSLWSQSQSVASASYGSRKKREALQQQINHRQGRDPTMYMSGLQGRPDPDSRSVTSSRYPDDIPSLKPKRDPTEYLS